MSIFVCGDTHGTYDVDKLENFFYERQGCTKADYLIICGDVAVCGFDQADERSTKEFLRNLPVTVLFCDGNHENFEKLNSYPVEEWHGGKVHMIEEDIIHLMRGQVYDIDGRIFFVFGGAYSIDRSYRIKNVTWFEEEIPSEEEYEEGIINLERVDYKVDYVITHTPPYEISAEMGYACFDEGKLLAKHLQRLADMIEFREWYFGHLHEDWDDIEQFHCLWDNIIELEE